MTWFGVALAVHLLAIMWWIGGLAFVTLVFIPALRADSNHDPHELLTMVENRFAPQARIAVVLVGISGGYMLWVLQAWRWLGQPYFWWLDAMILYWLIFAIMLFIIEPLNIMGRIIFNDHTPQRSWRRFHRLHGILLTLGIIIIAAAVVSQHG